MSIGTYEQVVLQHNNKFMSIYQDEIKRLQDKIHFLETQRYIYNDSFDENSLINAYDQEKIISDMKRDFPGYIFDSLMANIEVLFKLKSNIQFVYNTNHLHCPNWYNLKYPVI